MLQFVNPLKTFVMIFHSTEFLQCICISMFYFLLMIIFFLLFFIFVSLPLFDKMAQTKHLVFRPENDLFPRKADTTWVI